MLYNTDIIGGSFPTTANANLSISTNAEILLRELNACREAVLPEIDPDSPIQRVCPEENAVAYAALTLNSVGVKEIIEIQVEYKEEDLTYFYYVQITDKDNMGYFMIMNLGGDVCFIHAGDKNGGLIWADYSGPPAALKWWHRLPGWVQWFLRWICFGWLWMKP